MHIREAKYSEMAACAMLALNNWGPEAAERCRDQMVEYFKGGRYAPIFYVADLGDPLSRDYIPLVMGVAAMQPTMIFPGSYDFIYLAVHPEYRGEGIGRALTQHRIDEVRKRGGAFASLVTQKPKFFNKFGFMTLHGLGNGWVKMLAQFKLAEI